MCLGGATPEARRGHWIHPLFPEAVSRHHMWVLGVKLSRLEEKLSWSSWLSCLSTQPFLDGVSCLQDLPQTHHSQGWPWTSCPTSLMLGFWKEISTVHLSGVGNTLLYHIWEEERLSQRLHELETVSKAGPECIQLVISPWLIQEAEGKSTELGNYAINRLGKINAVCFVLGMLTQPGRFSVVRAGWMFSEIIWTSS